MDTTETTEPIYPEIPPPNLVLNAEAKYFLHTSGKWASFLGILGFIGTAFIILCAAFIGTIFSFIGRFNPGAAAIPGAMGGVITFFYLLFAVFYFFLSFYIYQFGTSIKRATTYNDSVLATKAFRNLKSHLKLVGITAIVIISLYVVIFVFAIIAGVSTMH